MSYFIGIDASTTATKVVLIDKGGRVLAGASSEYPYETPQPLWSEQDPDLWWRATVESIGEVFSRSKIEPRKIEGIGLTGQMHGLVLMDEGGCVLRPAILWNDQRTGAQCDEIRTRIGKERLIQITGNDALTGFTAPKILWVQQEEPEVYERIFKILLPKDYVRFKLTDQYGVDCAGGAGTLLFDLRERSWSPEVLEALEINPHWLPATFEGTELTYGVSHLAAEATGLLPGTPVFGGGGDQAAAAVGTGAVEEGIISISMGTSGVVFAPMDQVTIEPEGRLHAFCHAVPGKWHFMGVMLSAGGSLRWHREVIAADRSYDEFLQSAADVPAGSDGLIFLPYLTGERTPYPDPHARGAFVGLTVRHALPHMTRAVLEGVAFGMRDSFELIKDAGLTDFKQVRATGGGAKSSMWRQILADVLETEIVTVNTEEGAAFGAALLAAVGARAFPDVPTACQKAIDIVDRASPAENVGMYQKIYPVYRDLYPSLRPSFNALSTLSG